MFQKDSSTIIETTGDGSHTLYDNNIGEHYHSTNGAIQESNHIYINTLKKINKNNINLLEIGFGTGLNTFMTLIDPCATEKNIKYISFEKYPLSLEKADLLNYAQLIDTTKKELFNKIHSLPWGIVNKITPSFSLLKLNKDVSIIENILINSNIDIIYYDAFSPQKQPEMWTQNIFDALFKISNKDAILTTYCSKGSVRRMLKNAGFEVNKIPGPLGKREIIIAQKTTN